MSAPVRSAHLPRVDVIEGVALPLPRANVDTDTIIRIQRCAQLGRDELGPYAFESLRLRADGSADPDCPLNDPRHAGATILIAGDNFGCGSSREMAVWALMGMGLRCIVAPRFGDIFHANCFQNGLLPVCLPPDQVQALMQEAQSSRLRLRVDLQALCIEGAASGSLRFEVEALRRRLLLEGLDEIGLTLTRVAAIEAFEAEDRQRRPWMYQEVSWPAGTGSGHPDLAS